MAQETWLLLTYKVPADPATRRVALWRKIKALGAIYLQNGVCMLPKSDEIVRRLKMLENDISEMGGESVLLESAAADPAQEEKVIARFRADRDEHYREFLGECAKFEAEIAKEISIRKFTYAELEEEDSELRKLQDWLEKIRKLDFYGASLFPEASERLKACEELLDSYAKQVFEANEQATEFGPRK
jgi:hypothetical protein